MTNVAYHQLKTHTCIAFTASASLWQTFACIVFVAYICSVYCTLIVPSPYTEHVTYDAVECINTVPIASILFPLMWSSSQYVSKKKQAVDVHQRIPTYE